MAFNQSASGRVADFHVEVQAGATPTMTGTPDTYLTADEVLASIAAGNSIKGVAVYGEALKHSKGSTAKNGTFTDGKPNYL